VFYLRFFAPGPATATDAVDAEASEEPFFGVPDRRSLYRDAFDTFVDVHRGPRARGAQDAAWGLLLASKLEDATACGHFVDTMLRTVYFGDGGASRAAAAAGPVAALNGLPLRERPRALRALLASHPGSAFCVRVEVDNSHVYLLDVPPTGADGTRRFWRVESVLYSCDSRVTLLGVGLHGGLPPAFEALLDRLASPRHDCDCFTVREYDSPAAVGRFGAAGVACFGAAGLARRVPFGTAHPGGLAFEAAALELVYRLNAAAGVEGSAVWQKTTQFLMDGEVGREGAPCSCGARCCCGCP
jgi:hypothetical protein